MENTPTGPLERRIERLERHLRFFQALAGGALVVLVATAAAFQGDDSDAGDGILRARGLVIEDSEGRARVVLGSPIPDPKGYARRTSPATGLTINDEDGYERFGLGLTDEGHISMGFDAPHGVGDARNPERINIVVSATGESMIRFLDHETRAVGFLRLDGNGEFAVEFVDWKTGKTMRKSLRYDGERIAEWK